MEDEIEVNRYYLIDDEQYFFSGIEDIVEEELSYSEDLKNAISFETIEEARRFKENLKENFKTDFNIVKINFEFIKEM